MGREDGAIAASGTAATREPSQTSCLGPTGECQTIAACGSVSDELRFALVTAERAIALVVEGDPMHLTRKTDKCPHGRYGFEGCESCIENALDPALELVRATLAKVQQP